MSDDTRFDASPPSPYSENWREAYKKETGDIPRVASYQSPGGEAIPFIQKGFRFSGGQSSDTAEYPFGGLWSNEYLNEKPQCLTVDGYLRGPSYIALRNRLIEALRVPTDDNNPGYIDLPFWGRFPVVVGDNYEVSENADEQGQCEISIPFTRAGVSPAERQDALASAETQVENAIESLRDAAIDEFDTGLIDWLAFAQAFGHITQMLLGILGRIQGAKNLLNTMTGKVLGIINLVNQAIRAPRELAAALFNAIAAIAAGIQEIKNSVALYGQGRDTANGSSSSAPTLPAPDNERNAALMFLSASDYSVPLETATVSQENAKKKIENLYRTAAFLAAANIISGMDFITHKTAESYWRLLEKLEESISRENTAVYAALRDTKIALSQAFSRRALSREMSRHIAIPAPLLYLAFHIGCDEDKLRKLNPIDNSFEIEGDLIYV